MWHRGLPTFFSVVAILKSLKAISKPIYWLYRTLQKAWRKIGLLFKGGKGHYMGGGGALAEAYARTLVTNRLSNGNQMMDDDYKMFWSKVPISLNDPAAPNPAQFQKSLVASMMQNTCAWTLVLTKKGYLGLGPTRAQKGDLVCVLYGCSVPVVIRKYGRNHRFVRRELCPRPHERCCGSAVPRGYNTGTRVHTEVKHFTQFSPSFIRKSSSSRIRPKNFFHQAFLIDYQIISKRYADGTCYCTYFCPWRS